MPHYHNCNKCGVQVSVCSDDQCQNDETHANYGLHYCSEHHPDPQYHVAATAPVGRPMSLSQEAVKSIADAVVSAQQAGELGSHKE